MTNQSPKRTCSFLETMNHEIIQHTSILWQRNQTNIKNNHLQL